MGWTVLYIAFGIVALWLLGEVLLQYKARLRWRLLAFGGFAGVVAGVLMSNVLVIGLGAAAFAVGQTCVTLSFRQGFEAGWAVNAPAGLVGARRRRPERGRRQPTLEVSGLEAEAALPGAHAPVQNGDDHDDVFTPTSHADATAAETTALYEPQPLPDDTGSYGVYAGSGTGHIPQTPAAAGSADPSYGYDPAAYGRQDHGYDTGQQYAAYSDPYIGTPTYGGEPYETGGYDTTGLQQYTAPGYVQDPYTSGSPDGYGSQTPAGGVWVPQQRSADDPYGGELPPEQTSPHPGNGPAPNPSQGYDEQYRF
jgi:hypothetical protein